MAFWRTEGARRPAPAPLSSQTSSPGGRELDALSGLPAHDRTAALSGTTSTAGAERGPVAELVEHRAAIVAIGIVIALASLIPLLPASTSDFLTQEDGPAETLGALGLFAASLLFFGAYLRTRHASSHTAMPPLRRLSLLALGLLFFFGAGEEVSWGARIFDFATPADIRNTGGNQTNLHNTTPLGDFGSLFQIFWFVFAGLIPVICAVSKRARGFVSRIVPILPLWLTPLFLLSEVCHKAVLFAFDRDPSLCRGTVTSCGATEVLESTLSVLFALAAWHVWRATPRPRR